MVAKKTCSQNPATKDSSEVNTTGLLAPARRVCAAHHSQAIVPPKGWGGVVGGLESLHFFPSNFSRGINYYYAISFFWKHIWNVLLVSFPFRFLSSFELDSLNVSFTRAEHPVTLNPGEKRLLANDFYVYIKTMLVK